MRYWMWSAVVGSSFLATMGCSTPSTEGPVPAEGSGVETLPNGDSLRRQTAPTPPEQTPLSADSDGKKRDLSPQVEPAELTELVQSNNEFALALYQQFAARPGSFLISPLSASAVLSMASAGAKSETERQMRDTLHFKLPAERHHKAFNLLDLTFLNAQRENQLTQTTLVNSIWTLEGYPVKQSFLDSMIVNYGSELTALDFGSKPDESAATINRWVAEKTGGRIKDLIDPANLNETTKALLVNAIHFIGKWQSNFDTAKTAPDWFTPWDKERIRVPMMRQEHAFSYVQSKSYEAVELFYSGGQTSMVLIMPPDRESFRRLEQSLELSILENVLGKMETKYIDLVMPTWKAESVSFNLKEDLQNLGMRDAFDPQLADFTGISSVPELHISEIVQKTFIDVDEYGTEAAASTGITLTRYGTPDEVVAVHFNRPFLYLIRDIPTQSILFIGRLVEP